MSIITIKSKIGVDRPDIKMSELITEILYYYDPVGSAAVASSDLNEIDLFLDKSTSRADC